jgi:hypothetical protein
MRSAVVALVLATTRVDASPGDVAVGIEVGVPGQGSGAPIVGTHVPGGLTARYELAPWRFAIPSITAGIGTPIAGVGASAWGGLELDRTVCPHVRAYIAPGLRTGLVGPGYYARRSDVFVGYAYNYSGPWTVAPRLALGATAPIDRVDIFVEAFAEAPLLPTPELLLGGALGVRVRL